MKRPISVTLISFLFIVAGVTGIIYHAPDLKDIFEKPEVIGLLMIRLLAIVGGILTLRRASWARWLLLIWIVFHAVLSIFHPLQELIMHLVITLLTAFALFNPKANVFFRQEEA